MNRYFYVVYNIAGSLDSMNWRKENGEYMKCSEIEQEANSRRGSTGLPVTILSVTELTKEDFATWIS